MTKLFVVTALIIGMFPATSCGTGKEEITGLWTTEEGKAKIEIYHCGQRYCGKIAWMGEPLYPADDEGGMGGKPRLDRDNPNKKLRGRPLLGLEIMKGFEYIGNNTWRNGSVYDPETGKTYKGKMTLVSPHRLELRGYVGIPMFGRTSTWTR